MSTQPSSDTTSLIAGKYRLDAACRIADAGGLPAYAVSGPRGTAQGLMALRVARDLPPRAGTLRALRETPAAGMLCPVAHGAARCEGEEAHFIVCSAPPGPSLKADPPWPDAALLRDVLRPAAKVLETLRERGLTHRAIRPDNLFRAGAAGAPVVLGDAVAAPSASLQPALYEPPYVACCLPACRGGGSTADDVYALGVTLITLALGRPPLGGLDDDEILRRKLGLGSYAALTAGLPLPGALADLLRGMLAEDPDHRPSPALLADPAAARQRRAATRAQQTATTPLAVGRDAASNVRSLALALGRNPEEGARVLRSGVVETWLRRSLGNVPLAQAVQGLVEKRAEEQAEAEADAMLVMSAVAKLDPLAPLFWRGVAFWPEGAGPALAFLHARDGAAAAALVDGIRAEIPELWGMLRGSRADLPALRRRGRQQRAWLSEQPPCGGPWRLVYGLNPLLACASPLLAGRSVVTLADVLPALEAEAARTPRPAQLLDAHVLAFIAARADHRFHAQLAAVAAAGTAPGLAHLRLLAQLQAASHTARVPQLAAWIVEALPPTLAARRSRERQQALAAALRARAGEGRLELLRQLLEDADAIAADRDEAAVVLARRQQMTQRIEILEAEAGARGVLARRLGQEITAVLGLAAAVIVVLRLGFG